MVFRKKFRSRRRKFRKFRKFSRRKFRRSSVEFKLTDKLIAQQVLIAGSSIALTDILSGSTQSTRVGRKITLRSAFVRWTLKQPAAVPKNIVVRMLLVVNLRQNPAANPALVDVLGSPFTVTSPLNEEKLGNFKILMDKCITLSELGSGSRCMKVYKRMSMVIRYRDDVSVSQVKNGLYLMFFCDAPAAANEPTIEVNVRLRFTDS